MRKICGAALVLVIVEIVIYAAPAPERHPLGGFAGIILISSVRNLKFQEELKLSEDQVKKLEALMSGQRGTYASLRGMNAEDRDKKLQEIRKNEEAAIAKILTLEQRIRAEQIQMQILGPTSWTKPQVAAALKLTDEQKEKMTLINKESLKEYRESRAKGEQQPLVDFIKRRNEKLLDVLTPAQKAKWRQLIGEPYKRDSRHSEEKKQPSQVSEHPALAK